MTGWSVPKRRQQQPGRTSGEMRDAADHLYDGTAGDDDSRDHTPDKSGRGGAVTSPRDIDRSQPYIGEGQPRYREFVANLYRDSRG